MIEFIVEAGAREPERATASAAGFDLFADSEHTIAPARWASVATGIRVRMPEGVEGQIRPRSGMARRSGITVLNAPGTIDADYTGIVEVILINHGHEPYAVKRGDRIAQIVFARVINDFGFVTTRKRGSAGFGSTGR